MGYIVGALAIGAAALGITGGYRAFVFVRGIMTYKARAKSERVRAPPAFMACACEGSRSFRTKELFRLNDGVMGGKSSSTLEVSGDEVIFTGIINTNGGGFASFRTHGDEDPLGLPASTSDLLVDATGDGQRYKMTLYEADSWEMMRPVWCCDFVATETRATHRLPIHAFRASRQGRPVNPIFSNGTPGLVLAPAKVTGMGFSLSLYTSAGEPNPNFGPGPFKLVIHGVTSSALPARRAAES